MGTNRDARKKRLTRFFDNGPKSGMAGESSQKTKIAKSAGTIPMNCDHCGLAYETYAAWAKRYSKHFCSAACRQAYQIKRVEKSCEICGTKFFLHKCKEMAIRTCSKECGDTLRKKEVKKDSKGKILYWESHQQKRA